VNYVVHVTLGEGRRVAIPASFCQRFGIQPGDPLVLEVSDHVITLRRYDEAIREVQTHFMKLAPADVIMSDELSRDRRAETKRETND
jgi:AbrB family looped-hinge helix DNA binding protein